MNKTLHKRIGAASIFICILITCMTCINTSYATTTQDTLDDTREQINDLEDQKKAAENQTNDLENQKDDLEDDLDSLNDKLTSLTGQMNYLEDEIANKEAEIEESKKELEETQKQAEAQYEEMKTRIQFMYENGTQSIWEIFVESGSFSDFLNRSEYVSSIHSYDRQKLEEYQTLCEEISEEQAALEEAKASLEDMLNEKNKNQDSVNTLIDSTQQNISQTDSDLASAQENLASIEAKITEMEEYEKQLEEQKAKEDAARIAAIKAQELEDTSSVVYVPADSDLYLLGAIIQCEADGESYEGKLAVGSVVLNRVKSSYFPDTISGVIYQSGQFSPVASGRLAYRLQAGVNATCLAAAQEVLDGNITLNSLYFRRNNGLIDGTVIGNHVFY